MAKTDFKLPKSSFKEIEKLLKAYAKKGGPCSLDDLNQLTGMNNVTISSNNGFLESIGAIQGGNSKEVTETGKNLGLALSNGLKDEVRKNIKELFTSNDFMKSMLTALEIKPRSQDEFKSHLAYSLGEELKGKRKTGANTVVEMMLMGDLIREEEGMLYPNLEVETIVAEDQAPINHEANHDNDESKNTESQISASKIVSDLGKNVTLNINIQLTIPDTDDEEVYDNFFKAMKKNLLS